MPVSTLPQSYGFLDGIRIRALAGVIEPDEEYTIRDIFRWYSEKFSTPLHEVENVALEFVLLNWFEVQYQELDEDEQITLARELIETPEQRKAREESEKKSDDAFLQKAREQNAKKQAKQDLMRKMLAKHMAKAKQEDSDGLPVPQIEKPKEEVIVKYLSTGDMEAELDRPNGPLPGKKKS